MKYILVAFLLIGSAKAQVTAETENLPEAVCTVFRGSLLTVGHNEKPFTDTVRALILCSDTVPAKMGEVAFMWQGRPARVTMTINGYVIRKHYWPDHPDYSIINEQMDIEYIGYLDERKRPLKYFVWLSK